MKYAVLRVAPRVYLVTTPHQYDLGMLFLRVQEFYESYNNQFRGGKFTLVEYMDWYAKNVSSDNTFSYTEDWVGFNLPGERIESCYKINDEWTPYDRVMLSIYSELSLIENGSHFYVIGAVNGARDVVDHELAHGLFYVDEQYRLAATHLVEQLSCKQRLFEVLTDDMSYTHSVCHDETQAYMATGLMHNMQFARRHRKPFIKLFTEARDKLGQHEVVIEKNVDLFGTRTI